MTSIIVERELKSDGRFYDQQANQAIRGDVTRVLIELITNSDDSYTELEATGEKVSGEIVIEYIRKTKTENSVIRITDEAKGMADVEIEDALGYYGKATSTFHKLEDGTSRGFHGRGLKDSIIELGEGHIHTFKKGWYNHAWLASEADNKKIFRLEKSIKATRALLNQFNIKGIGNDSRHGTVIEISIRNKNISTPLFDTLAKSLRMHYALREILQNDKRKIIFRQTDDKGRVKNLKGEKLDKVIDYTPPVCEEVLNEKIMINDYDTCFNLTIFKSHLHLTVPSEVGAQAEGGIMITLNDNPLDLELFKFNHNEHASKFFGKAEIHFIQDLLKENNEKPIIKATRDGLYWDHPFLKLVKKTIEDALAPLVEKEEKKSKEQKTSTSNKKLRLKINDCLKEINKLAEEELNGQTGNVITKDGGTKIPFVPESGFGFVPPDGIRAKVNTKVTLNLVASLPQVIKSGEIFNIKSDNENIAILTNQVTIEPMDDYPYIGKAKVYIEGSQVGALGIITACNENHSTEAIVEIVAKIGKSTPTKPNKYKGIFKDIIFDSKANPKQRVRFEHETGDITIATRANSIKLYMDENGDGAENPQGTVLLSELISEAVCRELSRRRVQSGEDVSFGGSIDATQAHMLDLQNKYTHLIHKTLSDNTDQIKRRRTKEEIMEDSIEAV